MRLAMLGFHHETNTFAAEPTSYDHFVRSGILRGAAMVRAHRDAHSTLAGFFAAGDTYGVEVVPLSFAQTNPSGTITDDAFNRVTEELLHELATQGPWDGILLALHGAAVAATYPDADGEAAARVRAAVGPDVPIGLALDLHANVSARLVASVTATVLYRTNPHLDPRPRALECAGLIVRTVRGEIRPVQALEMPPLVINIVKQFTGEEPMAGLMRDTELVMARPGMLSASVAQGYPYADVAEMGMAFLTVHDGDLPAARAGARWLARRAWGQRTAFQSTVPSPAQAVARAAAAAATPVVLMDVGDNIGGGSTGDSTVLLAEAVRQGVGPVLLTLYDPQAVAACVASGVGSTLALPVGGKAVGSPAPPVVVTGRVRLISDGRFEDPTPTHGGWRFFDAGTTAVLETSDGHTVVLTSRLVGNTSIQQMYALGIKPQVYRLVVAKGVVSPRPAYAPIAAEIVLVDTPGVTTANIASLPYRARRRPLYPFEIDAAYNLADDTP